MKTLALVAFILEEKARQLAGDAQSAYGGAVDQASKSSEALGKKSRRSTYCGGADGRRDRLRAVETASALVEAPIRDARGRAGAP